MGVRGWYWRAICTPCVWRVKFWRCSLTSICWFPEEIQQDEWGRMRKYEDKWAQIYSFFWTVKSWREKVLSHFYLLVPRGSSPINYITIDCSEMLSRSKCQHISCCSKMFIYLHASTISYSDKHVYYQFADQRNL